MTKLGNILVDSSTDLIKLATAEVTADHGLLEEVLSLVLGVNQSLASRAGRVLQNFAEDNPDIVEGRICSLASGLNKVPTEQGRRTVLRLIMMFPHTIDQDAEGGLLDTCLELMRSPFEPIAVRYYAMHVVFNISRKYREIVPELIAVIEEMMPDASKGLANAGRKFLKILKKEEAFL